ncbi:MAG TPA: sterol carrier family protein [Kineosporiaceae bacterium]|nr:sterol carrier family protein [Kineosporiaceae bacterium]
MPPRRRIDPAEGRAAAQAWFADPDAAGRDVIATAVRWSLEELAARRPGRTCEVRVPPFGVVQCLSGPRHSRGTPPNVIEADAATWLALITGRSGWAEAVATGRVRASGERADLSGLLPLTAGR